MIVLGRGLEIYSYFMDGPPPKLNVRLDGRLNFKCLSEGPHKYVEFSEATPNVLVLM